MYVNSNGVVRDNPKQNYSFASWPQRQGHASMPHRSVSRLSNLSKRANSALGVMLIFAVIASAGIAYSVRTQANAHAPASVNGFGKAVSLGDPQVSPGDEVVAITSTKKSQGYWIATKKGQVFPFGQVVDAGEIVEDIHNSVVDIASTPTGKGYWLMTQNGNIYTFGDAVYYSTPEDKGAFGKTFVKFLPTKSGKGYTLVENNGSVMTFGDAVDYGNALGLATGDTIVDARTIKSGKGYVMLSSKGAVFTFGDANFYGSVNAGQITDSATAILLTSTGKGYWVLTQNGSVITFGDAVSFGNAAEATRVGAPSIDIALHNSGSGYWIANGYAKPAAKPTVKIARNIGIKAQTVAANADANAANPDIWLALRNCEAGGNYQRNSGNGYYGAYQFSAGTWNSMNTGYERADLAPPEVQDDAARRLQARSGWGQWPACSRKIGVR